MKVFYFLIRLTYIFKQSDCYEEIDMGGCAAINCSNQSKKCRLFAFPSDPTRKAKWVQNMRRDRFNPTAGTRLCEYHFEESQYEQNRKDCWKKLKPNAIPTIFDVPNPPLKLVQRRKSVYVSDEVSLDKRVDNNDTILQESFLLRKHGCHKMCRLCACLVYEDNLLSIFGDDPKQQDLLMKINRLLSDKVQLNDGLPHHVCCACVSKVNECNNTVDAFLIADKKLRDLFANSQSLPQSLTYIKLEEGCAEQQITSPSFVLQSNIEIVNVRNDCSSLIPERNGVNDNSTNVLVVANNINVDCASLQGTSNTENYCETHGDDQDRYPADNVEILQNEQDKWSERDYTSEVKDLVSLDLEDDAEKVYMCLVCRMIFKERNELIMHEISDHAVESKDTGMLCNKRYKRRETHMCSECGKCFPGLKPLKRHVREYHIPAENICEYCGAHYKIRSQLEVHRRLHTDEKPFTCSVCNESFHFKKALKRHKRIHVEPKSLTCNVCNKTFSNRSAMWRHEQIHSTNRSVLCYLCGKILSNSQSLRVHMRTHSTDRPCSCPTCGKTFRDNISVNKHMIMHSAVKNFKCDICGRAFYSKGLVKQHKLSHSGVKPYKCEVCGAAFNRLGNLNQHKKKHVQDGTLEQIRPNLTHMCVICGKMMKSELTLKYHLARHTGEKKPFDCEVCGKRFVAVDPYRVHMRIHTGERPYECSLCEKTFRSAFTLKQHAALHKDEFPYPCTFCERRFKRLQSLIVHKRTHTGEKPHPCPICGRGFAQKGDMIKHTKTHNREKKSVSMELEHITELVLSDTEITSEFLIDMPIVEVETEMNSDMHAQIQSEIHSQIQADIDAEMKSAIDQMQPVIASDIEANIHSDIGPCIRMEIQPDIHNDIATDITSGIKSEDLHSEIHTVIETEMYGQ